MNQHQIITAVESVANQLRIDTTELMPELIAECKQINWIYNPLDYAWLSHREWIRRFCGNGAKILLVGMNPGHGMGNTGIPFGCPEQVRNFLSIKHLFVGQPPSQHPKRLVLGLQCRKPEISGRRIWSFLSQRYGSADDVSRQIFVINHCPLWMFNQDGKNITPDKLTGSVVEKLTSICNYHLQTVVEVMNIQDVIGVGRYAEKQAVSLFKNTKITVDWVPHPSPASPFANRNGGVDWQKAFSTVLDKKDIGFELTC